MATTALVSLSVTRGRRLLSPWLEASPCCRDINDACLGRQFVARSDVIAVGRFLGNVAMQAVADAAAVAEDVKRAGVAVLGVARGGPVQLALEWLLSATVRIDRLLVQVDASPESPDDPQQRPSAITSVTRLGDRLVRHALHLR